MKLKSSYFFTLRENVKDEDSTSGNLLTRAGMIKRSSAGIYMYLPLGFKVLENIRSIIKEEMDQAGAQELLMPSLIPEEVYERTGRRKVFGPDMFELNDRFGKEYVLAPTHEELFTIASKLKVRSYKDLPFNLYQFETKFRDEPRPRFGLVRVREFIMKDAYSFDKDLDGLDHSYQLMYDAYKNIFDRLKIEYRIVKADTGAMGGLLSEEFQALADMGEDTIIFCENCDFASNIEVAPCHFEQQDTTTQELELKLVETKNAKTIDEVSFLMNETPDKFVKTIIYKVDNELVACLVRGDREVNETKLQKLLKVTTVALADAEEVRQATNAEVGYAGPIHLNAGIVMDQELQNMKNFVTGANMTDHHYKNVNVGRDFTPDFIADIRNITEDDCCPNCNHALTFKKGIEVGNTFKLGTKYSKLLNLEYLDQDNNLNPVVMGSYGIGLGRCMGAIVEQHHDDKGIIWPVAIAPYKVGIILISEQDEAQVNLANQLYDQLQKEHIDVLLDDRKERPGIKFKDMDLIGLPLRITVGKKAQEGIVEWKTRTSEDSIEVAEKDLIKKIKEYLNGNH